MKYPYYYGIPDEELEANKRKPMKRSGFMKRLEEMQKMQEEQLRKQKEAREANKRR